MRVLVAGLLGGLAGAFALTRLLRGFLFHVRPMDPLAFAIATTVVAAAVILASLQPARRAARIDPSTSLRDGG